MTEHAAHYDVVVVGGGSAGVAAGVGAAQCGARTLLLERCGFLGGAATRSLVLAWCGVYPQRPPPQPAPAVAGVLTQVTEQLKTLGVEQGAYFSASGNWPMPLNPEATKIALERTLQQSAVEVRLHSTLVEAHTRDGRVRIIRYLDGTGVHTVHATAFVDASGDAVLAHLAGATPSPLYGPDHRAQPASVPVRISGVPSAPDVFDRAARAHALSGIQQQQGKARLRRDGGILTPIPGSDDMWWLGIDVDTDGLDGADLSQAEQDGRAMAWNAVQALRTGAVGFAQANLACTGESIGLRETRHVASVEPLRERALLVGEKRLDGIGKGCWPMEVHQAHSGVTYNSIGADGCYDIPLGALHSLDFENLWLAGRNIGADAAAYASARVMGTCFATGHAAGVAAAMPDASVAAVRAQLLAQSAIL